MCDDRRKGDRLVFQMRGGREGWLLPIVERDIH